MDLSDKEFKIAVMLIVVMIISLFIVLFSMINRKSSYYKISAKRITISATFYYSDFIVNNQKIPTTNVYENLKFYGVKPEVGDVRFTNNGKISIALKFDNKCYIKGFDSNDIKVIKYSKEKCVAEVRNG